MRPFWTRGNDTWDEAKWKSFALHGYWKRLAEAEFPDKHRLILILKQLCHITLWLAIIGYCQVIQTCHVVFG